jgi:Glycosyltransferase family 87
MTASKLKFLVVSYLIAMVGMHASILWRLHKSVFEGYSDFAAFYTAGRLVQQGRASDLYDPHSQWEVQQQFASEVTIRKGPLPYIRPPFEALLFLPLSYLKYQVAYLLWTAIKVLLLLAVPFLARPVSGEALLPAHIAGVLCLGLFPVGLDLLHGQDSVLLLLVLVLTFQRLRRGDEFWSGFMLGLGLFKFHLVIPIAAVFFLRRKGRFSTGFLLTGALFFAISVGMVGLGGILEYPKYVWSLDHAPGMGVTTWQNMPNLRALLTALSSGQKLSAPMDWLWGAIACVGIAGTAWLWGDASHKNETRSATGFSLAVVITLLTSYYAYGYDLTLLLAPTLLLGGAVPRKLEFEGWPRVWFIGGIGLFMLSPVYWVVILFTHQFYWVALLTLLMLTGALAGMTARMRTERRVADRGVLSG